LNLSAERFVWNVIVAVNGELVAVSLRARDMQSVPTWATLARSCFLVAGDRPLILRVAIVDGGAVNLRVAKN
jgi:hypothetical protein